MTNSVEQPVGGVTLSSRRNQHPPAPLDNRSAPQTPAAYKHGMQLRSSSRSLSPVKKKPRLLRENPSPPEKKDILPPVIVRPDSPLDALSSETLVLRPKPKSSPTKDTPPPAVNAHSSELKPSPTKKQEDNPLRPLKFCERPENIQRWAAEQERILAARKYAKERRIPSSGFTVWEMAICGHYMWRRAFEDEDPIPSEHQFFKAVLDQVRATRGYGVTIRCGCINPGFTPLMGQLEYDPKLRELADDMIKIVLGAIKRKMGKKYTSRGVEKLVRSTRNYFLTLGFSDPTATPQYVEALFLRTHMGSSKNFERFEWKIKQGSEVIFTTAEILK